MSIEEFKKIFLEEANKNNIKVNDKQIENLYKYMVGIIEWNDKVNVTAIVEERLFIVKHFIDSLLQPFSRLVNSAFHRANRDIKHFGHFFVFVTLNM